MLKYASAEVVLQEVPDEIALAIAFTGCSLQCKKCHSPELWHEDYGESLTIQKFEELIDKNKHITCICFYGGEWQSGYLLVLAYAARAKGLKICLYTGKELDDVPPHLSSVLDYLKVGPYVEELGGLSSPTTNQRMYRKGEDITHVFQAPVTSKNL